jgi:predicted amidohydrolase YtcJ
MTDRAYAYGGLQRAGARLVNGSDAPVEELDPLAGLCAGVRRTLDDRPPWHPEHAVSVEVALRAMTVEPAWLTYDEHRRGRLLPGQLADLVVLDRDLFTLPPSAYPEARVLLTLSAGETVHAAAGW